MFVPYTADKNASISRFLFSFLGKNLRHFFTTGAGKAKERLRDLDNNVPRAA
jgi:hypothetical protein